METDISQGKEEEERRRQLTGDLEREREVERERESEREGESDRLRKEVD